MVLLTFLLFFLSTKTALAQDPVLTIDPLPSSATIGESFPVTFIFDNINPQIEYYLKVYEDSDNNKSIEILVNNSWQNSYKGIAWASMPKFSSDGSTINGNLQIRANAGPDKQTGNYQIYLKTVPVNNTTQSTLSGPHTITINSIGITNPPSIGDTDPPSIGTTDPPSIGTTDPPPEPTHQPSVNIDSIPESAILGESFSVSFTLNNINPQTDYYFKFYEDSDSEKSIDVLINNSWQNSYKGATWSSMPKFSSNDSTISQNLQIRANPEKNSGDYQIFLKTAPINHTNDSHLSQSKTITINSPAPTSTLTPSPTPSPTPSRRPSLTPLATTPITITPTPTPPPQDSDNDQDEPKKPYVLGIQDIKITPSPKPKNSRQSLDGLLPKILRRFRYSFIAYSRNYR